MFHSNATEVDHFHEGQKFQNLFFYLATEWNYSQIPLEIFECETGHVAEFVPSFLHET